MGQAAGAVRLLRSPVIRRLWLATFISHTGDWLLLIALPVYLFGLTGSGLQASGLLTTELLAQLAAGQVAGLMADRYNRRTLVVAGSLVQAVSLLPLLAVQDRGDVYLVYVVAGASSIAGSVSGLALNALLPDLVAEQDLIPVNGVLGVALDLSRLVGASAGGLALAWGGLRGVVLADAVSFLALWLLFARRLDTRTHAAAARSRGSWSWGSWSEGLAAASADRALWGGIVVAATTALAQGIFQIAFVVFVLQTLRGSAADVGLLRGVLGVGSIAGGVAVGVLGGRVAGGLLAGGSLIVLSVLTAIAWNGPLLTTSVGYYQAVFTMVGVPGAAAFVGVMEIMQRRVRRHQRGRVFALLGGVTSAGTGAGLVAGGFLTDHAGAPVVLNVQAALLFCAGVLALVVLRPVSGRHRRGSAGSCGPRVHIPSHRGRGGVQDMLRRRF